MRGVEQLGIPLLPHEPPHTSDDHLIVFDTPLGPDRGTGSGVEAGGIEPHEIDAVAEQSGSPPRRDVPPPHAFEVFGILHELGIGEARGDRLQREDDGLLPPTISICDVEAVHRVHHDGNARETSDHPAVEPGLGIVRVQDIDMLTPEQTPEIPRGTQIGTDAHSPGRRLEREMSDTIGLEAGNVRPRSADADDRAAAFLDGPELREQEISETAVHGREMGNRWRPSRFDASPRHEDAVVSAPKPRSSARVDRSVTSRSTSSPHATAACNDSGRRTRTVRQPSARGATKSFAGLSAR